MRPIQVPALLAVALAACGSPGRLDGTIDARPVAVASAVLVVPRSTAAGYGARLWISDRPALCETLESGGRAGEELYLQVDLSHFDSEARPLGIDVGEYRVLAVGAPSNTGEESRSALVTALRTDAACRSVFAAPGASGVVRLREVAPDRLAGTFAVEAPNLSVSGEFSADRCPQFDQQQAPSCR
jgi:hypothetical protein